MRIDLYMKTILTVIAVALLVIACKPVVQPNGVAAQGPFAGVQFFSDNPKIGIWAVDTKTGDLWQYNFHPGNGTPLEPERVGRITQLGKPIEQ